MARELNDKQLKFAHYLMEGLSATRAYCRAYGHDYEKLSKSQKTNARTSANDLRKHPGVAKLLDNNRAEWMETSDLKKEEIILLLVKVIRGEEVTDRAVVTESETQGKTRTTYSVSVQWAVDRLCRILGFNEANKHEITLQSDISRDDLEQELARLEALGK